MRKIKIIEILIQEILLVSDSNNLIEQDHFEQKLDNKFTKDVVYNITKSDFRLFWVIFAEIWLPKIFQKILACYLLLWSPNVLQ